MCVYIYIYIYIYVHRIYFVDTYRVLKVVRRRRGERDSEPATTGGQSQEQNTLKFLFTVSMRFSQFFLVAFTGLK